MPALCSNQQKRLYGQFITTFLFPSPSIGGQSSVTACGRNAQSHAEITIDILPLQLLSVQQNILIDELADTIYFIRLT